MKVHELIAVLKGYPPGAEVVAYWDGGWAKLDKHKQEWDERNKCDVIEFDVSDYGTYDF